jgi:hypothetical protein
MKIKVAASCCIKNSQFFLDVNKYGGYIKLGEFQFAASLV